MHIPLRFAIHLHSLILTIFDIQYFCYITFLISKITTHTNKKKLYYNKCQPSGLAYWCPHIRKLGVVYCRHDNKAFEKHPCHFLDSVSPLLLLLLLLPLPSKKKKHINRDHNESHSVRFCRNISQLKFEEFEVLPGIEAGREKITGASGCVEDIHPRINIAFARWRLVCDEQLSAVCVNNSRRVMSIARG